MSILPVPPSLPPANQKSATSMRPFVPRMRSTLSWSSEMLQETSATMPPGKCSSAEAHSSTPDWPRCASARHLVRLGERLSHCRPGDQPRHRNGIAADVENAAAGEIVGIEPVLRHEARHGEAEARLDHPHFADRAGFDQLDQLRRLRMQPVHEGFAEKGAGLARRMDHRVGLEGGQPHRLFAKHMLAGLRRLDRPFGVARMRRRNVDRVDVRIGEQRLIAVEDAGAGESLRRGRACPDCARRWRQACRCANGRRRRQRPWRWCRARECPSGSLCSDVMCSFP